MNEVEAAAQLQTIRTLMERAALYRRALGPTLLTAGVIGCLAALGGELLPGPGGPAFIGYWLVVALVVITACVLLMRTQALRAAEPFWTPPARRIASAMLPPLVAGAAMTVFLGRMLDADQLLAVQLPPIWMVFYGLAVHAAGFFTLRGVRWLGWAFVLTGAVLGLIFAFYPGLMPLRHDHLLMGATFGLGHLAAGGWLMVQERKSAA